MSAHITPNDLQRLSLPQLHALLNDLQAQAGSTAAGSQAHHDALRAIQMVRQMIAIRRMPRPGF